MNPEIIITGAVSLVGGVLAKIVFDWLRNGRKRNSNGNPSQVFMEMLGELREIKACVVWSKDVHNNYDPNTGQPRWYTTGVLSELRGIGKDLRDMQKEVREGVHLDRKNREMLLRVWARLTGGTDPGGAGD